MKKFILFLIALGAVAGGWYWMSGGSAAAAAEEEVEVAPVVETTPLRRQSVAETLDVLGVVGASPAGERVIAAPYDCIVRTIQVSRGTPVAAGDVLMTIEASPDAKLEFDAARSALDLAIKALATTQSRFDLKLATNDELLAAQQAQQDAELKFASLQARGLGGDGRIVSAGSGVVSGLEISGGAVVSIGEPLITIVTSGEREITFGLEASDFSRVAPGQPVTLASISRSNAGTIQSAVRSAGGTLDVATGEVEVRVPVPQDASLLPGEHVRGSIVVQQKVALVAPRSAVLPDGESRVMYTVQDGRAVRHEVEVGIVAGDLLEVSGDGLREGDVVVTLGNYELEDGMAVRPTASQSTGGEATP